MGHIIEVCYDSKNKTTSISSDDIVFDTERIKGVDISEWIYPFLINGVKWYGIYEELRNFYKNYTYTIIFDGTAEDIETLKKAFKDKNVNVNAKYSKVVILYDESQFMTRITINGKIFDTQRIEKRSIDEWVQPFSFKAADWKGIFGEIESYLGNDFYNITFVGKQDEMNILMDNAPENISIFFKPPVIPKKKIQTPASDNSSSVSNSLKNTIPHNINEANGKAMGLINGAKIDYQKMQENDSSLLLFGKIAVIVAVICCIVFTVFMSRFLMMLSVIPSLVFCVLAFTKDYKKLAISTLIVCISLAIISWIIITIRWSIAFSDINDTFDDINDVLDDANKAFDGINDAFAGN